jgi:hypothetical protein
MRYLTFITFAILLLSLAGCLRKTNTEPMSVQCPRLIKQAQDLYDSKAKSSDKAVANQAANLITGAKIDQEHQEFIQCMDKASRAIKLIDPSAVLSVQYNN